MLILRLLGAAAIDGSERRAIGRAGYGRQLAILARLALARGRPVSRDRLVALLWPESSPERARPQLSNALYILRNALGDDVVNPEADGLRLNPDRIESDASAFEGLLDQGRPAEAVELYHGPLLDGFHLRGSVEFDSWLDRERARLDDRYRTALDALAEAEERQGHLATAAAWWRRLSAHDPYNGRIALRLMQALEAVGDRAGVIQHARVHSALMREEFDSEPDADITALADRVRHQPGPRMLPAADRARAPQGGSTAWPEPVEVGTGDERRGASLGRAGPVRGAAGGSDRRAGRRDLRGRSAVLATLGIVMAALAVYGARRATGASSPPPPRSIGVMPFVDMGVEAEDPYLGDGLAEQIITALGGIEGLQVAARTSSFALRNRGLDARAIGDTLGVDALLEGSVRVEAGRFRVTAQLVDTQTGYHVWTRQYDRELADAVTVQDEIASAIALELRLAGRRATTGDRTPGFAAYDAYLRGLFLRGDLSAEAMRESAALFDRAIAIEPEFAAAWAAKASVTATQIFFGYRSSGRAMSELRAQVARSLELDPSLGEAHAALGMVQLFFDWDWAGAERSLLRAIELNRSDPHAWHHMGNYHRAMGHGAAAIAARERAVALNPLNARSRYLLSKDYSLHGEHERALEEARHAARLDPFHPLALGLGPNMPRGPADVYLLQGRDAEALEEYVRIAILRGATVPELGALRQGYVAAGMPGFWRSWASLDERLSDGVPNPMRVAAALTMAGDTAEAIQWLDRARAARNPGLIFIAHNPPFERLRAHPRFLEMLREMDFPEP